VSVIGMCLIGFLWIRVVVKVLRIPQGILSAFVVLFCIVGAYANRNSVSDVWVIVVFGVLGYAFEKLRLPIAPMVLGTILGPLAENSFMQTMVSYHNDWTVFFRQRLSGTLMIVAILAMCYPLLRHLWRLRDNG
jgi:putative tricarboxylic transport membrane protein